MELEFDKEIDAILRKARDSGAAAANGASSPHLDADGVAAFVENALPPKAKLLYIEHFADCGDCRRMLAGSISMYPEAVATAAPAASEVVLSEAAPWYQRIFRTPNLAVAMGALVLTFGGILGYFVLMERNAGLDSTISQVKVNEQGPASPGAAPFDSGVAANSAAQPGNISASKPANAVSSVSNSAESASGSANTTFRSSSSGGAGVTAPEKTISVDGLSAGAPASDAAEPPPPPAAAIPKPVEREDYAARGDLKDEAKELAAEKRKSTEDRRRDMPPAAAKAGPARSGPVQLQSNQANSNIADMKVRRAVGGKTFENRNGIWYDSAYRDQATTLVRRSSGDFKTLDAGVRNIANELGGTVVIVWKGKALRIF